MEKLQMRPLQFASTFNRYRLRFIFPIAAAMGLFFFSPTFLIAADDFFTPPKQTAAQPSITEGREGRNRLKRFLGGDGEFANWEQVKMIPSLNRNQRREIQAIYQQSRETVKPLMAEAQKLRSKIKGGALDTQMAPGERRKALELREQIVALRQQTWQKVKAHMTPAQLQELDQMRKGELMLQDNMDHPADMQVKD